MIAILAGDKAPFTKTNISGAEIAKNNIGQDIPLILNQQPSVLASSDAGNGVGYTEISIRGTDVTRINMTLNGLPYNDAESQAIYFVDLPDFASSASNVQIQRGIGTSSNGAGAFGASINFATNEFNPDPYAEFNNSFGSFNTWKNTLKAGSGLLGEHFTVDIRLSRISSNGYVDRATSDLKSAYFSAAYLSNSGYSGALYNTVQDSINLFQSNPRTYNYFTYKNQTDNYIQNHYQGFLNHQFSDFLSANIAAFLTRGKDIMKNIKIMQPMQIMVCPVTALVIPASVTPTSSGRNGSTIFSTEVFFLSSIKNGVQNLHLAEDGMNTMAVITDT